MPDDRFLHRRAGHSDKVNLLTDLEYRVWTQYLLSADDFGVMRASAVTLQADNDHLAGKPAKAVQRCLEAIVDSGLVRTFEHQKRRYVYQHDWQDWQKIAYPRSTNQPKPPDGAVEDCSENTRLLFALHPGGAGRTRKERSGNVPETVSECSALMRAGAPAKRLTANGSRLVADGERPAPLVAKRRPDAAFEGARGLYVPQTLHGRFVGMRNHPEAERELWAFYEAVCEAYANGPRKHEEPDPNMFKFWEARYVEKWPPTAAQKSQATLPAWMRKAGA